MAVYAGISQIFLAMVPCSRAAHPDGQLACRVLVERAGGLNRRPFLADNVVMGLVQFGLLPVLLFNSLHPQDILGFSPIMTGLGILPVILPVTVAAQIGGRGSTGSAYGDRY